MMSGESATASKGRRLLLVEDDVTISNLLAYNLRRAGYEVIQEYDGRGALETALSQAVDMVLMDLMLPRLDGMTASREILRRKPKLPLIVISALSERETQLKSYGIGIDDYVTKPFDLEVLLARISAGLRRAYGSSGALPQDRGAQAQAVVELGELVLDNDARALRAGAREISVSPKEHSLMELLLSEPGRLFPRQEITERVWHHHYLSSSRTLDVHMRRLRDKLRDVEAAVTIQAVRGVGYRLAPRELDGR